MGTAELCHSAKQENRDCVVHAFSECWKYKLLNNGSSWIDRKSKVEFSGKIKKNIKTPTHDARHETKVP